MRGGHACQCGRACQWGVGRLPARGEWEWGLTGLRGQACPRQCAARARRGNVPKRRRAGAVAGRGVVVRGSGGAGETRREGEGSKGARGRAGARGHMGEGKREGAREGGRRMGGVKAAESRGAGAERAAAAAVEAAAPAGAARGSAVGSGRSAHSALLPPSPPAAAEGRGAEPGWPEGAVSVPRRSARGLTLERSGGQIRGPRACG